MEEELDRFRNEILPEYEHEKSKLMDENSRKDTERDQVYSHIKNELWNEQQLNESQLREDFAYTIQ